MKTTKPLYYFKFIVCDHCAHEFNTYKQALKLSKRLKESISLDIFNINNNFKEPYDSIKITSEDQIFSAKQKLIETFNKYV